MSLLKEKIIGKNIDHGKVFVEIEEFCDKSKKENVCIKFNFTTNTNEIVVSDINEPLILNEKFHTVIIKAAKERETLK